MDQGREQNKVNPCNVGGANRPSRVIEMLPSHTEAAIDDLVTSSNVNSLPAEASKAQEA